METTAISTIPARYRTRPDVSQEYRQHELPRPVWENIVSHLDATQMSKLALVCRLFYLICYPTCSFCSPLRGDPRCHSRWRDFAKRWPELTEKYPDANCALVRNGVSQMLCSQTFQEALMFVRENSCAKGRHILVDNPKNDQYFVCFWCRRGVKKSSQCTKKCDCGEYPCTQTTDPFHIKHICTICTSDGNVQKSYRTLEKVRASHRFVEINVGGKAQEHRLFEYAL